MFKLGQRIKNIDPRENAGANVGEKGMIVEIANGKVYVEYDNGDTGNSAKPEKYYQILNEGRICKEWQDRENGYDCGPCEKYADKPSINMNPISSAIKAVKRALMSSTDRALIDAGLKDECGTFTATAIELLNQSACEADVASGANSVLVSASTAILADRKAKKEANS